ncbi:hypothetical protein RSSM_01516 [Rhodopirellula sallentina SM41]|uniref:Uncharacterized protein n=1 Tax=Rhodopirellula sallentina SM41 TaxID=1263870 RepID=M5U6F2_9BACT|nr:hypothetical protein RSSM_01516 [Rhodopirellula sallentina SM41]
MDAADSIFENDDRNNEIVVSEMFIRPFVQVSESYGPRKACRTIRWKSN